MPTVFEINAKPCIEIMWNVCILFEIHVFIRWTKLLTHHVGDVELYMWCGANTRLGLFIFRLLNRCIVFDGTGVFCVFGRRGGKLVAILQCQQHPT